MLTNARSLSPKIHSLHTMFEEHKLDVALISESWLKDGEILDKDVIDLEYGTNMKIIYRNRSKKCNGRRKVGGGVSIVYNLASCSFRERKITGNDFELVAAVGKIGKVERPIAIFCIYVEPTMRVADLERLNSLLSEQILALKTNTKDPLIFVGGDTNHRDLLPAFEAFDDFKRNNFGPTRGQACLDVMYSNATVNSEDVWPPLETSNGVKSDHSCVVFQASEPKTRKFVWLKKTVRKHTEQACAQFGRELREIDWNQTLPDGGPDELLAAFEAKMGEMTDRLFPLVKVKQRSSDPPWITNGIRRLSRRKARTYKEQGKSRTWLNMDYKMSQMVHNSKVTFVSNVKKGGTSTRKYFSAVRSLAAAGQKPEWSVSDLYPSLSPVEAGNEVAEYFTKITDQFTLLQERPVPPDQRRRPVTLAEVRKKMKDANKPASAVEGDVLPRLVKRFHHDLSIPATMIFNSVFASGEWPKKWKTETTVIIPKTSNPASLAECRNISCTAFLSKVLESILLEDIRGEIPPDDVQYGGMKACLVNHLLVDLHEECLGTLDQGDHAVVMGIDYEKAFNRLNHQECLDQLQALGASQASIWLVRSFLTNRKMRVKIAGMLSDPRELRGGSPQGSILGCLLYCLTTQQIGTNLAVRRPLLHPPPAATDPPTRAPDPGSDADDQGFGIMEAALPEANDSGSSVDSRSSDGFLTASGSDYEDDSTVVAFKYVDDTTSVERVPASTTTKHFTTRQTEEQVPAPLTTALIEGVVERTEEIGMRVNAKKTQIVVMSPDNGCSSSTSITVQGQTVASARSMKLLGFMLNDSGNMNDQVALLKHKFRVNFWSLINLNKAGLRGRDLYQMYCCFVRPVLETNSVVFHSMLTRAHSGALERMQSLVLKLCFGFNQSYAGIRSRENIDTLEERREKAVTKFVGKNMSNPRFGPKWFRRRNAVETNLRRRDPFIVPRARTARYYRSPLQHMQRVANTLANS